MLKTKDNIEHMSDTMQQIMDQAKGLVDATSGEVNERIKSARTALKKGLDIVESESGPLEDRLQDLVKDADKFIHVKPYYAIGVTFFTGLFLGWFLFRQ